MAGSLQTYSPEKTVVNSKYLRVIVGGKQFTTPNTHQEVPTIIMGASRVSARIRNTARILTLFLLYGCFTPATISSASGKWRRAIKNWRKRLTDTEVLRLYFIAEWKKVVFLVVYLAINMALFAFNAVKYYRLTVQAIEMNKHDPLWRRANPWYRTFARGFGMLLNFNSVLVLLPTFRTMMSTIRGLRFGVVLPLDKNIIFHRYVGYMLAFATVGHTVLHYLNYSCCYVIYGENTSWRAAWKNKYSLTGQLLTVGMVVAYAAASKSFRRSNNFSLFWIAHHFYIVYYILLLLHGRMFWAWFFIPGVMLIVEKLLRTVRGSFSAKVRRATGLNSNVLHLELVNPLAKFRAGQFVFLNIPEVSAYEWHPFTISSAPEDETLQFHIRCLGDWTTAVRDLYNTDSTALYSVDNPTKPSGDYYQVQVDGPFGSSAEEIFDYKYVMMIAAGIGVTPYASVLKNIRNRILERKLKKDKKKSSYNKKKKQKIRITRVFFYWINRDTGSWEWFSGLLDDLDTRHSDIFQIHTFMTGPKEQKVERVEEQYQRLVSSESVVRAYYDYPAQNLDEMDLERGDEIEILSKENGDRWLGINRTTEVTGLFPKDYVKEVDSITKLRDGEYRHYGRPNWANEFQNVRKYVTSMASEKQLIRGKYSTVGLFVCGPSTLCKDLYDCAAKQSKNSPVQFKFHKESF